MSITEQSTTRFVTIGDLDLRYHEAGQGEPVLFLHGGGPGASSWGNFNRNIGPLSARYRVLALDLPGFGKSSRKFPSTNLLAYYAGVVRDFLDALKIDKVHLIGNSLGGGTALKFALLYPARAGRIVAMGTAGSLAVITVTPTEGLRHLLNYYAGEGPSVAKLKAIVNCMVYDASAFPDDLIQARYEATLDPDAIAKSPLRHEKGQPFPIEPVWTDNLTGISHDVLLIWGREDRVVPMDAAFILLKQIARARLHVFPQCGHWAQWEKADEFNALVSDFIDRGR